MKKYSFKEQIAMADLYEEKVIKYLRGIVNTLFVVDARKDAACQVLDTDAIRVFLSGEKIEVESFEIKVDFKMNSTGNLFVEEGKKGWLEKTRADFIFYLDAISAEAYVIPLDRLKEYVKANSAKLEKKTVSTVDFGGYEVEGTLVPLKGLRDNVPVIIYDLNNLKDDDQPIT